MPRIPGAIAPRVNPLPGGIGRAGAGGLLPGVPANGWGPMASTGAVEAIPPLAGPRAAWPNDPVMPAWRGSGVTGPEGPWGVRPPVQKPDGMDPSDDAVLVEMRRLLGESLGLAGGAAEVAGRLRAALGQAQPVLFASLPGSAAAQTGQLAEGLSWLIRYAGDPPALAAGFGLLGASLREFGLAPQQLQLAGAALAEAMRAGLAANGWRQDFDQAWRSTWQHAYQWIAHGMAAAGHTPMSWTAVVLSHQRRRDDLAVVRVRPYLPMPYLPGQFAFVEHRAVPGERQSFWIAGAPRVDNVVELHVRATGLVGEALVRRTAVGDTVKILRAVGELALPPRGPDLLMVAADTGVAPMKALITELAQTRDPRSAVLFWGVRTRADLYDLDELAGLGRATVVPVIAEGDPGPYLAGLVTEAVAAHGEWSGHEVFVAGPPLMVLAVGATLRELGVAPDLIHADLQDA